MHVLLYALGTRGDVQPLLALGIALQKAGHTVTAAASPDYGNWFSERGIAFLPVGMTFKEFLRRATPDPENGLNLDTMAKLSCQQIDAQFRELDHVFSVVDCAFVTTWGYAAPTLAEAHNVPIRLVHFSMGTIPSDRFPALHFENQRLPSFINRLTWVHYERRLNRELLPAINEARRARRMAPIDRMYDHLVGAKVLLALEPQLFPRPNCLRLVAETECTGAWLLEENEDLGPDLKAFLESGPKPIYFGFGSMVEKEPIRTTQAILDTAESLGLRVIISKGWAGLGDVTMPSSAFLAGPEPHGKLFPRCAAVVHHGGVGTATSAALAGVPQILVPHFADQFFMANQLYEHGLAPKPILKRHFSRSSLRSALARTLDSTDLAERGRRVSRFARRSGVAYVVENLERLAARTP